MTMPLAQVALHFGANDVQGTVVREEIFHAAGATHRHRAEDRGARPRRPRRPGASRCSATRSTTSSGASRLARPRDPPRPHLVREHGAGLLPARRRVRGDHRRPDRAEPRGSLAGEIDVAPISSIEYARNADPLLLLPRLCVSSEGAVDSIQLVSRLPLDAHPHGRGHARDRDLGRADEGAAARRRARPARRGGRREAADRRRGAEERVRGSDAAPRPRPPLARADRAADGVRRLGGPRAAAARDRRARGGARRVGRAPAPSPSSSPTRRASATATRPASSPATSRSSATASGRASAPASTRSSSWRATSASSTRCPSCASSRDPAVTA